MMAQAYPHPVQLNAVPQHAVQPQMHAGPPGQPTAVAMQHLNPHQGLAPGMAPQLLQGQQFAPRLLHQYQRRAMGHPGMNPGFPGTPVNTGAMPAHLQQQLHQQRIISQQQQQHMMHQAAQQNAALNIQQQHQQQAHMQQQLQAAQIQQAAQLQAVHLQQQHVQQQQQQAQAAQAQAQAQAQAAQAQAAQAQVQAQQQQQQQQQQQAALMRPQQKIGNGVLKLLQFCEHLSSAEGNKRDLNHWRKFVNEFYSHSGVMRHNLWRSKTRETKRFEITTPVLARYYYSLYEYGIKNIQLVMENAREREMSGQTVVESQKTSFVYWFENGTQVVAHGTLRAQLNVAAQIDCLEFDTAEHTEYIPRFILSNRSLTSSPDQKASPRVNAKGLGKRQHQQLPPPPPPLPDSPIGEWGVPDQVFKLLELGETLSSMRDLFVFSQQNPSLEPRQVLQAYVQQFQNQQLAHQQNLAHAQAQQANAQAQAHMQQQQQLLGMGTPHMQHAVPPGIQGSPAMPNSPHLSQNGIPGATPSPAQAHLQAPGMAAQHSQQHHGANGANGATPVNPNTSPNVTGKRRRASTAGVKTEAQDDGDSVPPPPKVKASPRTGNANKRQKQAS
ncbi:hypothetical protein TWF679_003288 [Orbilia oligospora]|uniref:LIM-domain binding protein-domain-containing protein n=1 Tax=Orbilia oligospora TaxID=2813651 RepID=A0A8H8URM7_ORBOL|nr:hypothetical protein TWF679_003288 [Orbilia oligospora]